MKAETQQSFSFKCSQCGCTDNPPALNEKYARHLMWLKGWFIDVLNNTEWCKKCTAILQTDGVLGPRPKI